MSSARKIVLRTNGQQHGFIRRLISPCDLGHHLKPFVFLDHVRGQVPKGAGFGFHPHSGIATLTDQRDGAAGLLLPVWLRKKTQSSAGPWQS
ncbi:MAG TPA: pirin family protein, partial [Pseudomonadota bacterium]|nr:pirin family protein [Pseudomonadota bacterium]